MTKDEIKGVYIAVLNQGSIRVELAHLVTELTHQKKYRIYAAYPADKPIANNRNKIVQDFLKRKEYDYLMMIDSDIIPPLNILDLVDYQKDVMGCVCFAYMGTKIGIIPLALKYQPNNEDPDRPYVVGDFDGTEGLVEVDAVGTGLIVIKREVLEALENDQPFCNRYNQKGIKTRGLDLSFCEKAKEKGFKVWCHLDFVCSHWVHIDLKDIYNALRNKREIKNMALK